MSDALLSFQKHYISEQNKLKLVFINFLPRDNPLQSTSGSIDDNVSNINRDTYSTDNTDSFLMINLESMSKLLKLPMQTFLSHLLYNESLQMFILTFLSYRINYMDDLFGIQSNEFSRIQELDAKVFLIMYRVLNDDYLDPLMDFLYTSSSQISVVSNNRLSPSVSSVNSTMRESRVLDVYRSIIDQLTILTFPNVMNYLVLLGGSNVELSSNFIHKLSYYRLSFKKEVTLGLSESVKIIHQLMEIRLKSSITNGKMLQSSKSALLHKSKTLNSSKEQDNASTSTNYGNLSIDDVVYFVSDIVISWSSFILASCNESTYSDSMKEGKYAKYHPLSNLLCGNLTGLTQQGVNFVNLLNEIYEVLLPDILKQVKDKSLNKLELLIQNIRFIIIQTFQSLILLSTKQLVGLPRSEIEMLILSDWEMEGSQSWIDWMQRNLTNEQKLYANVQNNCSGALIADLLMVSIYCQIFIREFQSY